MNLRKIKAAFRRNGYVVFTEPYKLNIVGVRSETTRPNAFDDRIFVFYRDRRKKWVVHVHSSMPSMH